MLNVSCPNVNSHAKLNDRDYLEDLVKSIQFEPTGPQEFDTSCFSGTYVTENVSSEYLEKLEQIRNDSAKQHSILSEEPVGIHNQT